MTDNELRNRFYDEVGEKAYDGFLPDITYKRKYTKWLEEQLLLHNVSNLLCGSFDPDNSTSSATKCKCGREKWEHPKAT